MADGITGNQRTAPANQYMGMTREELRQSLIDVGGQKNIKDKTAFQAAWEEAGKLDKITSETSEKQSLKSTPWSLVPLDELEQYGINEVSDLMMRLEKTLGIKPPKGYDLLSIQDLKAWLREKITSDEVKERYQVFEESERERRRQEARVVDITDTRLRETSDHALHALIAHNNPPRIFKRAGCMVRIIQDENGIPSIQLCDANKLKYELERAGDFIRSHNKQPNKIISPPIEVVNDILAMHEIPDIPAIEGIIESPVILPDGSLTSEMGYCPHLRMLYIPSMDLRLPSITERPKPRDITKSVELLKEIFEDFPFSDEASRTNTIAALITAVLRPVIPGYVPLALIDKPQPGIGASLMTDVIAMVATGRTSAKMTAPTEEAEWRKLITARLSQGQGLIIIDNVDRRLISASLASVLTSETWNDRVLGQSATITLSNHAVFIANGINVETGPDIARRVYWIRIDAHQARPDQRTDFHHEDLLQWVKDKRGEILAAILTIARAWYRAGCPVPPATPQMGSFEKWRGIVGGILSNAGISGFLGNLEEFRDRSDTLTSQWDAFLHILKEEFPGDFTVKSVKALLDGYSDDRQSSLEGSKTRLSEVLPEDISLRDKDPSRAIGRAFGKRADHVFPSGIVLRRETTRVHNVTSWRIEEGNIKRS